MEKKNFECDHEICTKGKNGERFQTTARSTYYSHRNVVHEGCGCSICLSKKIKKIKADSNQCRHIDCSKTLSDASNRRKHEMKRHPCKGDCLMCQKYKIESPLPDPPPQKKKRKESPSKQQTCKFDNSKARSHNKITSQVNALIKENCSLRKIRWGDLICHSRKGQSRRSTLRTIEEMDCFAQHAFQTNSIAAAAIAWLNNKPEVIRAIVKQAYGGKIAEELREEGKHSIDPPISQLSKWIVENNISKATYKDLRFVFNLGPEYSWEQIRKEATSVGNEHGIGASRKTPGGRGYTYSLFRYIRWHLSQENRLENVNGAIPIKISFDGCQVTSSRRIQAQTAVFQDMRLGHKKEAGYHFGVFIGDEDYETISQEFHDVCKEINQLFEKPEIEINGKIVKLSPFLTCDMKSLCILLGLYEVWRPGSKYRCPWCKVTKDKLADFSIEEWEFRDINEMKTKGSVEKKNQRTSLQKTLD
jgi:hypothetical protein